MASFTFWAQLVKNPPAMWETWVWSLGWENPLKGKATLSSILTWRIPWTTVHGVTKSQTRVSDFHFQTFVWGNLEVNTRQCFLSFLMLERGYMGPISKTTYPSRSFISFWFPKIASLFFSEKCSTVFLMQTNLLWIWMTPAFLRK